MQDFRLLLSSASRAGLTGETLRRPLAGPGWKAAAEENRKALFEAGLSGMPPFRVDGKPAHWGQDRYWALEQDIIASLKENPRDFNGVDPLSIWIMPRAGISPRSPDALQQARSTRFPALYYLCCRPAWRPPIPDPGLAAVACCAMLVRNHIIHPPSGRRSPAPSPSFHFLLPRGERI